MLISLGNMCGVCGHKRPHGTGAVGRGLRASGRGRAKGRSPLPWEVWGLRLYDSCYSTTEAFTLLMSIGIPLENIKR
jgi:hypothetical protein